MKGGKPTGSLKKKQNPKSKLSGKNQKGKPEQKKAKDKVKKDKGKKKDSRDNKKAKKKVAAIQAMSAEGDSSCATEEEDSSDSDDECEANANTSTASTIKPTTIPQALRVPDKKVLPGASTAPPPNPAWYTKRIMEEERPDLAGKDGSFEITGTELDLLDRHVRDRAELQMEDIIVNDDNYDEDDRRFVRYEIQLKYNEGRYSAIYIVSKQVCKDNNVKDVSGLFALKTGLRNGSSTFNIKMKRELRILSEMSKAKASWVPPFFDSGSVCDMPFIVMGLVDMNIDKLREMLGGKFKPASAFYIAGEVLHALCELHARGFVHRDVKPTNICVGVGPQAARVYLIDYGDTVRRGKKIRYGTPDAYTLPFWSIDFHRRRAATEKSDIESWFYTTADLFVPTVVTWKSEQNEPDVEKAKTNFWGEFQSNMAQSPPALLAIAETFNAAEERVDVGRLKKFIRAGLEQSLTGAKKYSPEWIRASNTATAVASHSKARSTPKEAAAT